MTPAWAQRREALLRDCLVSPDVFHQMVDRLGRQDNRSIIPLAAVPTRSSSFRLLTLACRDGPRIDAA